MQRIPLRAAKPGMVIAKEVRTADQTVLCGCGTQLSQEIIERLRRADITSVVVKGRPVQLPGEKPLRERLLELQHRFWRVKGDPVLNALMKLIAEQWMAEELLMDQDEQAQEGCRAEAKGEEEDGGEG